MKSFFNRVWWILLWKKNLEIVSGQLLVVDAPEADPVSRLNEFDSVVCFQHIWQYPVSRLTQIEYLPVILKLINHIISWFKATFKPFKSHPSQVSQKWAIIKWPTTQRNEKAGGLYDLCFWASRLNFISLKL